MYVCPLASQRRKAALIGWEPSPGGWGARPTAEEALVMRRLDRVGWLRRIWLSLAARRDRRTEWLWEHGGYDVETPEERERRVRRSARDTLEMTAIRAALDDAGRWPAAKSTRTANVEVVDVDRYQDFAVVVAAIAAPARGPGPALCRTVFRREGESWRVLGAGAGGSGVDPLLERAACTDPLAIRSRGWVRLPHDRRKRLCHATVLCSSAVVRVLVRRPGSERDAVMTGAGWLGVVWPQGSEPSLAAVDAAGKQIAALPAGAFRG